MAEHLEQISHDKINRYLTNEKLTPRILWDNVKDLIEINNHAHLVFDHTVLDKRYTVERKLSSKVCQLELHVENLDEQLLVAKKLKGQPKIRPSTLNQREEPPVSAKKRAGSEKRSKKPAL
ncbi:MAG: hypothetical protein V7K49_19795 [Nostoc sp.]